MVMKYPLLLTLLFGVSCSTHRLSEKPGGRDIVLIPTFEEGFGMALKRQIEIVRPYDSGALFLVSPKGKNQFVAIDAFTDDVHDQLSKIMAGKKSARCTVVGYETIACDGLPGESMSVDHVTIPSGPGWHVKNEFVVMEIIK